MEQIIELKNKNYKAWHNQASKMEQSYNHLLAI
jgi:hypothetical protein